MRWWVLLALAGCRGLLGLDEGVVGTADAPSDVAGDSTDPDDVDGDGVQNDRDNCPDDANRDQQDFDVDETGDVCDPCPHIAGIVDSDNDGVGNLCDPQPELPTERRVLWTTFDTPDAIATWTSLNGGWSLDALGPGLVQADPNYTGRITPPDVVDDVFVATRMVVTAVGPLPYLGVCSHVTPTQYLCCDVVASNTNIEVVAATELTTVNGTWYAGAFAANDQFDITHRLANGKMRCEFTKPGTNDVTRMLDVTHPPGVIALHVRQMAVRVAYLFVAATPP